MAETPAPAPTVRTSEPPREVDVTVELVRALLADQHADLAGLPIVHVEDGWDNAMFRLGDDLALRMPRRAAGGWLILTEQRWLPELAPSCRSYEGCSPGEGLRSWGCEAPTLSPELPG